MLIHSPYPGNFIIPPPITGKRAQGVPVGGPGDSSLSSLVQHLAQNQTVIEISTPISFQAEIKTTIAIGSLANSNILKDHPTFCLGLVHLSVGESISLFAPSTGLRAYASWSSLEPDSILPKPLAARQQISLENNAARFLALDPDFILQPNHTIRYIPASDPLTQKWIATPNISRVGTRLHGEIPELPSLHRSEPSIHGAIQVTPGNEILIHGPDGPTLGGYPKAGVVISADFATVAQLRPQSEITLIPVSLEEAATARKWNQEHLQTTLRQITQVLNLNSFPRP